MGDISGHGVQGALIMTAVKATIKMLVEKIDTEIHPSEIINQLNRLLTKDLFHNNYMTLVLGVINVKKKQMVYYNAGHPPIIRYNKKCNEAEIIQSIGAIPIGWLQDYEYTREEENTLHLDENSSYLFYTDGIFECVNKDNQELGISGVQDLLKICGQSGSTIMLPNIIKKQIMNEGYDISKDDFTILSMNVRREQNNHIRYYIMDMKRDITGDVGKHCEEFLKSQGLDLLSFSVELLVNEFLNKLIEDNPEQNWENAIVIRLRIFPQYLQVTFWDRGVEWEIPQPDTEDKNTFSSFYIINNLVDEIIRKRFVDVNETVFIMKINNEGTSSEAGVW
jgi:anti-sigma regulatory factor (Ser/Thr protein kinase)